ncbi:Leukocyte elastase inhibitor [Lamellibrachia satsuma]|nr:Leukocyte elastase inhibitor [Lamellibrachia satsuma]
MRNHLFVLGVVHLLVRIDVTSSYDVWKLARANCEFAFSLYGELIKSDVGKNVFFSPFSISTALAMTYAGARGKTAKEMCQVLKFCPLKFNIHASFRSTLASMNAAQGEYKLSVADGIFVHEKFTVHKSFLNSLDYYYSAGFKALDFHGDARGSAKYINKWVEDRTNHKIKNIVSPMDIEMSVMALANAIYFKGLWKFPFNPDNTKLAKFYAAPTWSTSGEMMIQTGRFRYSLNRRLGCQILEMPYKGDRLSMYILLPTRTYGLTSLERKLTFNSLTSALAKLHTRRLSVAIPKIKMTISKDLPDTLTAMGMGLAFMLDADFTGMSPLRPLFVSNVIHMAFIEVDEKGTEAAAATIVLMSNKAPPPPIHKDFVADHPFLFLIRDNVTGSILFLGRLMTPT